MLTDEKADKDAAIMTHTKGKAGTDVVFIIATWCMFGGNTASTWAERENGQKLGEKRAFTDWGNKMATELVNLGKNAHFNFDFCKPYITGKLHKKSYNYDAAFWCYYNRLWSPGRAGAAKHAAVLSPEDPGPAKRQKTTGLSRQNQQQTDFQTANEAQPKDVHSRPEQATANEADGTGSSDRLFAKLSRKQLEAMIEDLESKVERLEKQNAANFSPWDHVHQATLRH
ncbi:hypothetical protein INS49_012888 [Diaporthe citri]|uniref:uncharacterized protein n=1 Tax=Diaporthe citri TaxID=83186 RepID=UPI001C805AD3|nr:uncharacterized protein INS49_012888 [Diaporthe citri]KAG6359367.1 hypothetical protein INS49_012888 [Diaporthe citri]